MWAIIGTMQAVSYGVQRVARAAGIPVRRLEGWIERGVVAPTAAAHGTGTRARFGLEDALRVAIVADIQRLFGSNLRPGSIASKIGHDALNWAHVDTALRLSLREDVGETTAAGARSGEKGRLILYAHCDSRGLSVGATRKPPARVLETIPVALFVDPAAVWRRIRAHLED